MCSCCPLGCVATILHTRSIFTALRSKITLARLAIEEMKPPFGGKIENRAAVADWSALIFVKAAIANALNVHAA
jgi:hypothetical protein